MAVGDVADHRAAYRLLQSIETYFVAKEPSSLAVVLVTQARLLIGRPLVEALDALLETSAYTASITFGTDTGFAIPMTRMRELSGQANMTSPDEYAQIGEDELPAPEILSRDHAGMVLKQIEEFFRVREPASPIPILLFKARNMLTKDFHALVRELIPPSP
jgi:type VI secretion system protein ImpA